jgi:hypothetical protein
MSEAQQAQPWPSYWVIGMFPWTLEKSISKSNFKLARVLRSQIMDEDASTTLRDEMLFKTGDRSSDGVHSQGRNGIDSIAAIQRCWEVGSTALRQDQAKEEAQTKQNSYKSLKC